MTTRTLAGPDLARALSEAQAAFAAGTATADTWRLPAGRFVMPGPVVLGVAGRSLALQGGDTELVFDPESLAGISGIALSLRGAEVQATDLRLSVRGAGECTGLAIDADARASLIDVRVGVSGGDAATAIAVTADGVELQRCTAGAVTAAGGVTGIRAVARDALFVDTIEVTGLAGGEVVGLDLAGARIRAAGLSIEALRSDARAIGARLVASVTIAAEDLSVADLRGSGTVGLPFDDPGGDGVTALVAEAPEGRVERLGLSGLVADAGRVVPLRAGAGIVVADISHQRRLAGIDIAAMLAAAQDALAEAPTGISETWHLPAGEFVLAAGIALGVPGRSLTLSGSRQAGQRTMLRFFADGAGTPIAGNVTCLALSGDSVTVERLALAAGATGALTGIDVAARAARLTELRCDGIAGAEVTGIAVSAADTADLAGIAVTDAQAAGGALTGIRASGRRITLADLRVAGATAATETTGIDAVAQHQAAASVVNVNALRGRQAVGLRLRVPGAEAELSLLDIRVSSVETATGDGDAIGVALASGRDIDIRGLTVRDVTGARAGGVLAGVGRAFDWLAGEVRDIHSFDAGAAGVRLVALPSRPPAISAPSLALRDLQIEAVSGAEPGSEAEPPPSWLDAIDSRFADLLDEDGLGRLPTAADPGHREDIAGLVVLAPVTPFEPWIDHADPGSVVVENCIIRRVSGSAVQIAAALRDIAVRGCETWTALRGGWIDGERVLLANLTVHRLRTGLALGPGEFSVFNTLVTGVAAGPALIIGADSDLGDIDAAFVAGLDVPFRPPPDPLPYIDAGPAGDLPAAVQAGGLAPPEAVDLRLAPGTELHREARRVTGDPVDMPVFVGAHPPELDARCVLRDPLPPPPEPARAAPEPGPFVDYRARDAQAFLALMQDRAKAAMPGWTERSAADMTVMLMELLAYRLDQLAYRQESAVAEGFIGTARRRRSVEDHARLVDYAADPGLSATAMLRFSFSDAGKAQLGLRERFDRGEVFVIPRDTLVVNPDFNDVSVVFATETDLAYDEQLETLHLHPAHDIRPGALSAILAGDLVERVRPGRWFAFLHRDPVVPAHVVRIVRVELATDGTRIVWDPRRPAPAAYPADATSIHGNIVVAHHGVPVAPFDPGFPGSEPDDAAGLAPWREALRARFDNTDGGLREIPVPLAPVSVQAAGWPLPDEPARQGSPGLSLTIDGEEWRLIDDLSLAQPADPVFVLRAGVDGGTRIRFGDGRNWLALPRRVFEAALSVRIGLGTQGNVGTGALRRIVAFGSGGDIEALTGASEDRRDLLMQALSVRNDLPATGGRDPEPLERIRYRAPRLARNALTAVSPSDYERLLEAMPEVAGARAAVVDTGIRQLVRVVLLLRDEDRLTLPELGEEAQAERLRRWALARSRLEAIRLLGWDVELLPPIFVPLDLDLVVDAEPWAGAETVRRGVVAALSGEGGLFDPDNAGLGGDVHVDALHRAALSVPGVKALRVQRLRRLQPFAIDFAEAGTLPIGDDEVAVLKRPYGGPDGLLTVTVCGGLA